MSAGRARRSCAALGRSSRGAGCRAEPLSEKVAGRRTQRLQPCAGPTPPAALPPPCLPARSAAARGHLAVCKLLLQYGANLHHVNAKADGGSALHEAVAHRHEAVVELLLAAGGNPFVENAKARCRARVVGT